MIYLVTKFIEPIEVKDHRRRQNNGQPRTNIKCQMAWYLISMMRRESTLATYDRRGIFNRIFTVITAIFVQNKEIANK